MSTPPFISLNADWLCRYHDDLTDEVHVPSLADWTFDGDQSDSATAILTRSFVLRAVDFCVSYLLHLDSAPGQTLIFINGEKVGEYARLPDRRPLALDVTMVVALGDNEISFRVERDALGTFGDTHLEAVPCD